MAAFAGQAENRSAVEAILEAFPGYVQLGGGIRTRAAVDGWFDLGVARVVMGTAALKDPEFVKDMAREYPDGIVVAVDARDGMVATRAGPMCRMCRWSISPAGSRMRASPALLFTDIGRDGMLKGVNIEATVDLARRVDIPVIASGGVKGLDDIRLLAHPRAGRDRRGDYRAGAFRRQARSGGGDCDGGRVMTVRIRVIPCLDVPMGAWSRA